MWELFCSTNARVRHVDGLRVSALSRKRDAVLQCLQPCCWMYGCPFLSSPNSHLFCCSALHVEPACLTTVLNDFPKHSCLRSPFFRHPRTNWKAEGSGRPHDSSSALSCIACHCCRICKTLAFLGVITVLI